MNEKYLEKLISSYVAGVHHPEVSGMEHLHLLQIRSRLASLASELSPAQCARLRKTDTELLANAHEFLRAIQQIADLSSCALKSSRLLHIGGGIWMPLPTCLHRSPWKPGK